jgi:hypothetical protein
MGTCTTATGIETAQAPKRIAASALSPLATSRTNASAQAHRLAVPALVPADPHARLHAVNPGERPATDDEQGEGAVPDDQ